MEENDVRASLRRILAELKGLAEENIPQNEGDYFKDGLMYCGKCNTPKQCKTWTGDTVMVMCECRQAEEKEKDRRLAEEQKRIDMDYKRGACFDSEHFWNYTFEKCTKKDDPLYQTAKSYANYFSVNLKEGNGLIFYGNTGNGKTYFAAAIANDLLEKGYSCRMTNFETIETEARDAYSEKAYYKDLLSKDLLIIDDLGAERDTPYMKSFVTNILDKRFKPLIITTNMTSNELNRAVSRDDKRITSRIWEKTIPVKFTGEDLRREILREKYEKYKDILCLTKVEG